MENPKQSLRKLIAENDLAHFFPLFLTYTETAGLDELYNKVLLQQARNQQLSNDQVSGVVDYDDLARNRIAITQALLNLVDQLSAPEAPGADRKTTKTKGVKEQVLKRQIFFALMVVKVYLLGYVLMLWQAGTFPLMEFLTLVGIIVPLFATYLTVIFRDIAQHRYVDSPLENRLVRRSFQWSALLILVLYVIALQTVIDLYGQGDLQEFSQLTASITAVEGGLGVYLGQMIFSLFKKEIQ
jgi:hypothetical protein